MKSRSGANVGKAMEPFQRHRLPFQAGQVDRKSALRGSRAPMVEAPERTAFGPHCEYHDLEFWPLNLYL